MMSFAAARPSSRRIGAFRQRASDSFLPGRNFCETPTMRVCEAGASVRARAGTRGALASIVLAASLLVCLPPSSADARSGRAGLDRTERKVAKLVNSFRARHGRPRLHLSPSLTRVADRHSLDMARHGFFAHSSRNGTDAVSRVRGSTGARSVGENLAFISFGHRSPARQVVAMWINSPGHRAVLLNHSFRRIGVARRPGRLNGGPGSLYTADFASSR